MISPMTTLLIVTIILIVIGIVLGILIKRCENAVLKKILTLFLGIIVIISLLYIGNLLILVKYDTDRSRVDGGFIYIEKLEIPPEHYIEITEADLDELPRLKEALEEINKTNKKSTSFDISVGSAPTDFLEPNFKYEGDYYRIVRGILVA